MGRLSASGLAASGESIIGRTFGQVNAIRVTGYTKKVYLITERGRRAESTVKPDCACETPTQETDPLPKIELIGTGSYTALSTLFVVASVADRSGLCLLRPLHRECGGVSDT